MLASPYSDTATSRLAKSAAIIVLLAIMGFIVYSLVKATEPKSEPAPVTAVEKARLDSLRAELRTVMGGDFVQYDGAWCYVVFGPADPKPPQAEVDMNILTGPRKCPIGLQLERNADVRKIGHIVRQEKEGRATWDNLVLGFFKYLPASERMPMTL